MWGAVWMFEPRHGWTFMWTRRDHPASGVPRCSPGEGCDFWGPWWIECMESQGPGWDDPVGESHVEKAMKVGLLSLGLRRDHGQGRAVPRPRREPAARCWRQSHHREGGTEPLGPAVQRGHQSAIEWVSPPQKLLRVDLKCPPTETNQTDNRVRRRAWQLTDCAPHRTARGTEVTVGTLSSHTPVTLGRKSYYVAARKIFFLMYFY